MISGEEAPGEESPRAGSPRAAPAPAAVGPRRPLVAALVPDPDVWRVAGAGRTLVARRRADGRIAWASIVFDLKRPSRITFFGNSEMEEGPFEEILDALYRIDDSPPMVGGSASLASRFAHGALALARAAELELAPPDPSPSREGSAPPDDAPLILAIFGRPRGSDKECREALVGAEGICSRELVALCTQEAAADLPEGESLAVHVAMAFQTSSPTELARALAVDGDFAREEGHFIWRPRRAGGAKLGSVYLHGEQIEAETVSLDLAGLLCARLKRLVEGALELTKVEHRPLD